MVTLYNPLGHAVTDFVRIPVLSSMYRVVDPKGMNVTAQLVPVSEETKKIPERKGSLATNELFFQVELPPLGYSTYFVMETNSEFPSNGHVRLTSEPDMHVYGIFKGNFHELIFIYSSI